MTMISNKAVAIKFHELFDAGEIDRCCDFFAPHVELKTPQGATYSGIVDVRSRMNHGVEMIGPDNIKRAANTIVEDDYVRSAFSFFGREGEVVTIEEKIYMDDQHHIIRIERKRRL